MSEEGRGLKKREFLKFQALVVGLIWFLVLLALLRPLIFGRVIPSVLGLSTPATSEPLRATIQSAKPPGGIGGAVSGLEEAAPPTIVQHVVEEGETLYRIAIRYRVSAESLATANHIVHPGLLAAGQVLEIPSG